jgi:pimeloyl-ACP methyl ester carboxylesterase
VHKRSWADDASARGLRLVGYDRAGYGGSTRHVGRSVADVAGDLAALADSLGVERFFTWGVSGGGPHALACAALLGDRVIAAASVASPAPYDAAGLDFLAGMGEDNIEEFGAAIVGAAALAEYLAPEREQLLSAAPEDLQKAMESLLPDVDVAALSGDNAEFLHESMASGLEHGYDGWLDDDVAFVGPWGFDVTSIAVPLLLMQGELDLMVPYAHGTWLAAQLPDATVRLRPGEGHVSLGMKVPEVHEWLLEQG